MSVDVEILKKVHKSVFDNFKYKTDLEQYGLLEKWVMPTEDFALGNKLVGDCEDFALACRKLLRDQGVSNSRLVVALTETGEGHCVLEVEGWVLDNRRHTLVTKDQLEKDGYKWLAISGYTPGDEWKKVKNG